MKSKKPNAKGFSLIELLIVVAIILIIAAIAIPNLMRSKIAANQASAVGSLRTINTAQVTYASTYNLGFATSLTDLGPPSGGATAPAATTGADLIDSVLAAGAKSGYTFTLGGTTPASCGPATTTGCLTYTVTASPTVQNTSGQNGYFTDQTNVIRFNSGGTAAVTDSPIGG